MMNQKAKFKKIISGIRYFFLNSASVQRVPSLRFSSGQVQGNSEATCIRSRAYKK